MELAEQEIAAKSQDSNKKREILIAEVNCLDSSRLCDAEGADGYPVKLERGGTGRVEIFKIG